MDGWMDGRFTRESIPEFRLNEYNLRSTYFHFFHVTLYHGYFKPYRTVSHLMKILYCTKCIITYTSSLTLRQSAEIERVQKRALRMICYPTDSHYDDLLHQFDISSLDSRRVEILTRFAKSLLGSVRHRHLLPQPRHVITCHSLRNSDHFICPCPDAEPSATNNRQFPLLFVC